MTPSFAVKGGVVASFRVVTMISGMSAANPVSQDSQKSPAGFQMEKKNGHAHHLHGIESRFWAIDENLNWATGEL